MIKLEIKNIIDETNYEIPRLELWLVKPKLLLVEQASVLEYLTQDEFVKAYKKLKLRKAQLELEHNSVVNMEPSYPLDLKKRLKEDIAKIMSRIDEIEIENKAPKARVI